MHNIENVRWNPLKSKRLKKVRGVSFEEIIKAKLIVVRKHPSKSHQEMLIYEYKGYVWVVPYVIEEEGIFLKTIYPSRKFKKLYMRGANDEKG